MRKTILHDWGFALALHAIFAAVCLPLIRSRAAWGRDAPPGALAPADRTPSAGSADPFLAALWAQVWGFPYEPQVSGLGMLVELGGGTWLVHALSSAGSDSAVEGVGTLLEWERTVVFEREVLVEQGVSVTASALHVLGRLDGPAGSSAWLDWIIYRFDLPAPDGTIHRFDTLAPVRGDPSAAVLGTGGGGATGAWLPNDAPCSEQGAGASCEDDWSLCRACCSANYRVALLACAKKLLACIVGAALITCWIVVSRLICLGAALAICAINDSACRDLPTWTFKKCRKGCDDRRHACDPSWTPPPPPSL